MDRASRSARIEARIAPETLGLVRRAAEMEGRSVSEFVVAAAGEAARRAIERDQVIRLSVADQQRFADVLLAPSDPHDTMRQAEAAHRALIVADA